MRIHRLFGILSVLLSRETITARELAEKFEVSVRTIYRDIEAIEEGGIPLYATPGNTGGIGIVSEYKLNKTILSEDEMSYLMTGLSGLKAITDTDKLQILLSKLSPSSPYLTADSDILIDFSAWNQNLIESLKKKVELIRMAILNRNYLLIEYLSASGRSSLKIAPAKVIFKSAGWYLFGKSDVHGECRFYKITRIAGMEISEETFVPEPADIPEVWSDDFEEGKGELVMLAFDQSVEYRIIDIFGVGNYKKNDDRLTVSFHCGNTDWLMHFMLGFGIKGRIVGPVGLRAEYCRLLSEMSRMNSC